jgi:hypothetical protein
MYSVAIVANRAPASAPAEPSTQPASVSSQVAQASSSPLTTAIQCAAGQRGLESIVTIA